MTNGNEPSLDLELLEQENLSEYKWENWNFKNLIAVLDSGGCSIRQIDKITGKEKIASAEREEAWLPLTAIVLKYAELVNKCALEEINNYFNMAESGNHYNAEVIEKYLTQNLFDWNRHNMSDWLDLNNPLDGYYSFLKPNTNFQTLHLLSPKNSYSTEEVMCAICSSDYRERNRVFEKGIMYYQKDCDDLLKAVLTQSPHKLDSRYAVKRVFLNL